MNELRIMDIFKKVVSHLGFLRLSYILISAIYIVFTVQYVVFSYSEFMIQRDNRPNSSDFSRISEAYYAIEEADRLFDGGGLNESIQYLDDQINLVTDQHQKSIFVIEKAVLFLNSERYDLALNSARDAVMHEKSDAAYALLARIYEKMDEYTKAIENYNYAIYYSDIKLSDVSADVAFYEAKITDLKAKYE